MVSSIAPPLSSDQHVICQTTSGAERQIVSVSAAGADVVFVANVRNIVTICLFAAGNERVAFSQHGIHITCENCVQTIHTRKQFRCSKAISVSANKEISRQENADSDFFLSFSAQVNTLRLQQKNLQVCSCSLLQPEDR